MAIRAFSFFFPASRGGPSGWLLTAKRKGLRVVSLFQRAVRPLPKRAVLSFDTFSFHWLFSRTAFLHLFFDGEKCPQIATFIGLVPPPHWTLPIPCNTYSPLRSVAAPPPRSVVATFFPSSPAPIKITLFRASGITFLCPEVFSSLLLRRHPPPCEQDFFKSRTEVISSLSMGKILLF